MPTTPLIGRGAGIVKSIKNDRDSELHITFTYNEFSLPTKLLTLFPIGSFLVCIALEREYEFCI